MKACADRKYAYAALADGKYCFCSDSLPDVALKQADDTDCSTPCTNPVFSGYPCGGATHVSVYGTPTKVDAVLVTLTSGPAANHVRQTFQPVNVSVHVTAATDLYKLELNFGDNGGQDAVNLSQHHGITVLVQSPPKRVHVVCDKVVPADEMFVCNATVWQGSNMRMIIDWSDQIKDDFPIQDPVWSRAGSGARQTFVEDPAPPFVLAQGQHILISDTNQMFQSSGYVTVVDCDYCRIGDSCGQLCDSPVAISCPGSPFCPYHGSCSGQCKVTDSTHPDSFSVIDQKLITITQLGWGYQDKSGKPRYTDTGFKFMLKAVSAEPARVLFYHTYREAGLYQVTVAASAEYIPGETDINTTEILVQEKISGIVFVSPEYNKTGSDVLFALEPHKGIMSKL
ncbi:hypothetical protein LSH36_91g03031 [Paralvinella palmiformis]|uniref:WSC domain-containing protein n=1 Tax=Paralvinella palmiformis TaxID=53620 RepID=A0AAD9K0P5_9ANNE|nr:hypothetical protein LSH36_91g03031 [Paralvinella palmiformis]